MAYSVVVVTWRCAGHLATLVASMNEHLDGSQELLVVDNASSDDPESAMRGWKGPSRFIRLDFFVDRVRSKLGVIEPEPESILEFRRRIRAEHVQIYADVQVKYSTMADGPKPIAQSAREAATAGADAIIVTGAETGIGPAVTDLDDARAGGVPVLIGSGLSPDNAASLVPHADGFIVGTSMRSGRTATDRVVRDRVEALTRAIASA